MADIFDSYQLAEAWDEMFERPGRPRAPYAGLLAALQPLDPAELRFRSDQLARMFTDRGVTYDYAGEERPFPLDLIPRVMDAVEWDLIVRGVRQRVLALEAFLADVYGPRHVFADGVLPWRVVCTSQRFHREVAGLEPPNGVRVHVAGIDLVRDGAGQVRVLEDNVRIPSGVSYVIENRLAMTRTFPALFSEQHVHPVYSYPAELLAALRAAAPAGTPDPVVVVLTPGTANAAYFEHALLARLMGVELVEGGDLTCAGNRVYVHTTQGLRPVDVIYRRVDDDFLDPLQFRPDSVIGCPGIINAARAGHVTIANAVGNGVADDKLLYTWVPDLIRYYLREEPLLRKRGVLPARRPRTAALGARAPGSAGPQAGGRGGRERDRHRPPGGRGHPRRAARPGGGAAPGLDRPAAGGPVHRAGAHRRDPGAPAHRPAPVRGQQRERRLAAARRADPGRAARGRTGGQLEPRRRVQGHLGAGPARRAGITRRRAGRGVGGRSGRPAAGFTSPAAARGRGRPAERAAHGRPAMTSGLLSRIAETLFWTGRYIERADDTARMVDVYVHRMLEEPHTDQEADCRALLAVLGMPAAEGARLDIGMTLHQSAYDQQNPSAIAGAVMAARRGARSVREVISSDMWECLNVTSHGLVTRRKSAERLGPHVFLEFIRERAALFFGLADSTMSHDDAWRFLVLGRSLERVDMTARLLLARMPATPYEVGWPMLLRSCGAYESFIRTRTWTGDPQQVVEFLLMDRLFPRSVVHALATAEEALAALDPAAGGSALTDPARRSIGQLRTRLEYADPEQLPGLLPDLLAHPAAQPAGRRARRSRTGTSSTSSP